MDWLYFAVMDKILNKNPEVRPISLRSTLDGYILQQANDFKECTTSSTSDQSETLPRGTTPVTLPRETSTSFKGSTSRKSHKRTKNDDEHEPSWFKKFREESQNRHAERMETQKKLIEVLENFLEK